jgi:ABC-type uncharacterized transport system auxiliary subunit
MHAAQTINDVGWKWREPVRPSKVISPSDFRTKLMRLLLLTSAMAALLAGCGSTPNNPSVDLETPKAAADYAQCVFPKWQKLKPETTMTEGKGHYKLLISGKMSQDDILEVFKGNPNTRVFLYQRAPLASAFGQSALEKAARECL